MSQATLSPTPSQNQNLFTGCCLEKLMDEIIEEAIGQ